MPTYLVTWEIEVDAATPVIAAEIAQSIQRDPDSWATVYKVFDETGRVVDVDLLDEEPAVK